MARKLYFVLAVALLCLLALMPRANASFTNVPTFDLTTSSTQAAATNAAYSFYVQNPDHSEDAVDIAIAIPAGYSMGQSFMTNTAGIQVGTVSGQCPVGAGQGTVTTTTTPGRFAINIQQLGAPIGGITITPPTSSTSGTFDMTFTGQYSFENYGCGGQFSFAQGFFINPSTAGTYSWAPSTATPKSGPPVTMQPRPGFSQNVNIVTPVPEFPTLLLTLGATMILAVGILERGRTSKHVRIA